MKNPSKKPAGPFGKKAVWVRPLYGRIRRKGVWVVDYGTGYSWWRAVRPRVRAGHWRFVSVSKKAAKVRAQSGKWVPVSSYEKELEAVYELAGADPIYRYRRSTDVVRSAATDKDPLLNFVWGSPFKADNLSGRFIAMRTWYIVRDVNLDRFFLYGRTASFGTTGSGTGMAAGGLSVVRNFLTRLEGEINREYEEKEYMELVRFVAWTAYGDAGAVKSHVRRSRLSKEKGFDFDENKLKFKRVVTPWERSVVLKEIKGRRDLPSVLTRGYGGSSKKFNEALMALPKKRRSLARRYFMREVARMEKVLDKKRRGGQ